MRPVLLDNFLLFVLLSLSTVQEGVVAFPNRAGGCSGGGAAVSGNHVSSSKEITTGSIEDNGYQVAINGEVLSGTGSTFQITPGVDNEITVSSSADDPFRGFLIRVGWPEQVDIEPLWTFTPETNAQTAVVCFIRAVGVCHTNNEDKNLASMILRLDEEIEGITLDVTVVKANNGEDSTYFYSGYEINSLQLELTSDPVTEAPTPGETVPPPSPDPTAPVAPDDIPTPPDASDNEPSDIPSDMPSDMPSEAPTEGEDGDGPSQVPPETERPCTDEEAKLKQCYSTVEDEGWRECDTCVANRIPSNVGSCGELSGIMCDSIDDCDCEPCGADLEKYLSCAFSIAVGCPIECPSESP